MTTKTTSNRITKRQIMAALVPYGTIGATKANLHTLFGLNPNDEQDRTKVWSIGQGLAELMADRTIVKLSNGSYRCR